MPRGRPAAYRRALRVAMRSRLMSPARLIGRAPAIYDPLGVTVLKRTLTPGGVISGKRRRR